MAMPVHIFQRETIKPSSPTPQNLRYYKFSLIDQSAPDMYVPILKFYQKPSKFILDRLKESLSQTLSHFYHFAGRYKDACTLECNDSGVDFVTTLVDQNIDELIRHPKCDSLKQLIPYKLGTSIASQASPNDQPLVAIQVNKFSCGGICIASCVHHYLGDASSISLFLNAWARINRGDDDKENVLKDCIIMDTSSILKPIDVHDVPKSIIDSNAVFNPVGVTRVKRFVFDNPTIQALVKSATGDNKESPTRMEALCSFLCAAVIKAKIQRNSAIKKHVLYSAVNLRKKMNPPLPPNAIGNIAYIVTTLTDSNECSTDYKFLLPKLQKSFRMAYDDFVDRTKDGGIKFLAGSSNVTETLAKYDIEQTELFGMSSWCRFKFYDIDFGCGKPNYVCSTFSGRNGCILLETKDHSGIELMLSLAKEDVEKLEENKEFLAYASLNQSL